MENKLKNELKTEFNKLDHFVSKLNSDQLPSKKEVEEIIIIEKKINDILNSIKDIKKKDAYEIRDGIKGIKAGNRSSAIIFKALLEKINKL
ncbi:MAG: hypothetical protein ACQER9_00205 [Nanobdellota archaeon]